MLPILLGLVVALVAIVVVLRKKSAAVQEDAAEEQQGVQLGAAPRGVNRMQAGMRRRGRAGRAARGSDSEEEEEEEEPGGGRRAARRAAREAEREEQAAAQEAKESKRSLYEARRAAKEAEREAQEAAQEAEIARAAAERAKREEEEAAKWMHMFTVEEAGEDALSEEAGEALAARFVEHIRTRKTVPLDELAAEFGMKTADCVVRLQALEAEGRITGVMDDRGKFIFISPDEMQAVADFIQQRGRIAIAELAQRSNTFIDLSGRQLEGLEAAELELPPEVAAA